ncbi:MAG: hypothetical protein LUE24_08330 [Lachnospiraceae bacterium]|nr:hypothetical protein [Lachnospiraceae bacterium]
MLKEWCDDLLSLGDDVWGAYAYAKEPLRGRLSREDYQEFYRKAAACGREEAQKLMERYGSGDCEKLAAGLGITIERLPMPSGMGLITFACYYEPDRIELYEDNAREVQSLLEAAELNDRLGNTSVEDMLLAHELFHVVQSREKTLYINEKHIRLWKLGPILRDSRLVSLEEVAAMEFARTLLNMDYSPYVYDVLMLLPRDPEQAQRLYQKLMRLKEELDG